MGGLTCCSLAVPAAMKHTIVVHPRGLDPFQAAKAWQLRKVMGLPWKKVQAQLSTVDGGRPGPRGMLAVVRRIEVPGPGERSSRLERLVAGMPKRLAQCKANRYGKCSK